MQIVIDQLLNPVIYKPTGGTEYVAKEMKPERRNTWILSHPEIAEKHQYWYDLHQAGMSFRGIAEFTKMGTSTIRYGIAAHIKKMEIEHEQA
jgi:hypothetical protein